LVDCFVSIWFLLALLLFTDEPVFLNRLAAPECVFNLYPIFLTSCNIVIISFLEGTIPLVTAFLQAMALGQLVLYQPTPVSIYLVD
jgi:hypothetical protein